MVWRAKDPRLGRDVAIKVLLKEVASDPDRLRRFELEARATSALSHPNILTIFDVGTHKGTPFLVSELLDGSTLREAERSEPMGVRQAIDYASQIAQGLAAAHEHGIVHRDLKPDNIFVTADGRVKILDFGLARLSEETAVGNLSDAATATQLTQLGTVMGTIGYMAPEQVLGQPAEAAADVFAFGCLLYEMLSGVPPFARNTQVETLSAILEREPPESPELEARLPPRLGRILRRCLAKKPAERYPSGRELAADLKELTESLSSGEVRIGSSVWAARGRLFVRRRWPWLASAGAAILAAGLGLWLFAGASITLSPAGRPIGESVAVLPFRNVGEDPKLEFLCDGLTEELINILGRVEGLRVPGRTSSFRFKGGKVDLAEVGALLNVDSVLEGSVQSDAGQLRIRAQLVSLPDGFQLWSEKYDRERAEILAVQDEVAAAIVRRLRGEVAASAISGAGAGEEVDFETYELYLQGRYHLNQRTGPDMKKALEFFGSALDRDSGYARAWSGRADSYSLLLDYDYLTAEEAVPKAETAARRALELDPALADAHTSLALILDLDGRTEEAEREYRLAVEMGPRHVNANLWLGGHLVSVGRYGEALPYLERAVELDPLLPVARANLVMALYAGRRFEEAIASGEDGQAHAPPDYDLLDWWLAWIYAEQAGRSDDALAITDKWLERTRDEPVPNIQWKLLRAIALAHGGRKAEARELIVRIEEQRAADATYRGVADLIALAYAALGDAGSFVEWARETLSFAPSEFSPGSLEHSPEYDRVRSDPRFVEFLDWRRSASG